MIVLALFLLIPLFIGFASAKKALPTAEDYFIQSRSMGTVAVFFTIAATWWSAMAFLGTAGLMYKGGVGWWVVAPQNLLFGLLYYEIGRKVWHLGKNFHYITPGDIFADYYECRSMKIVITLILVIFTVPYLQIQLMGAGYIIETMTNGLVPFWLAGLLFYAVIVVYVWVGGIRAVALTDVFYGIMIFGGLLVGGFWIASKFGGVSGVTASMQALHEGHLTVPGPINAFTYTKASSMLFVMALGGLMTLPMWLRMYSVKEHSAFRYSIPFMGIIALGYLGTMLAAFCGLLDQPEFANPDNIFPFMLLKYTPLLLSSLVLAAAAAAAMSTSNSQVHAISTIVSLDIYKEYFKKDATQKQVINIGRVALLVFSAFAYIMALNSPSLLANLGLLAMGGTMQLFPALMGILYWRRATAKGAICGVIAGAITVALVVFIPVLKANLVSVLHEGVWGLIVNVIVFVIVSLCTTPPSQETRDRFTESLKVIDGE